MRQRITKPTKWHVHPAITQISLGIRLDWSKPLLCAQRVAKDQGSLSNAQSDQSMRSAHMYFCWLVVRWLTYMYEISRTRLFRITAYLEVKIWSLF